MKKILSMVTAGACLVLPALHAADATYINYGSTNNPQIDARAVVNYGIIQAVNYDLFDTQSTQYLTNQSSGTFLGYPGFRFDYVTDTGRGPSVNFVNKGLIDAFGAGGYQITAIGLGEEILGPMGFLAGSYVLVSAANIQNPGLLTTDEQGLVRLEGSTVDVSRGGIRAGQSAQQSIMGGRGSFDGTNYNNVAGILDSQPSRTTTNNVRISQLDSPAGFAPFAFTNAVTESNFTVQVIYVSTNGVDSNILANVRFAPPDSAYNADYFQPDMINDGMIGVVELGMTNLDIITGQPFTNFIYVLDMAALAGAQTNWVLTTNMSNIPRVGTRPVSFEVTRNTPIEWRMGVTNNTIYTNDLLLSPAYASTIATNLFAVYAFEIGIPIAQGNLGGSDPVYGAFYDIYDVGIQEPTNWPGRVEIEANTLTLDRARIRAESTISLKANQIVYTQDPLLDAPHLYLDLGTDSGLLVVSNLVAQSVKRLTGTVSVETHLYTNQLLVAVTNAPETEEGEPTVTTNSLDVKTHVLLVDYTQLIAEAAVAADEVRFRGNNVDLYDIINATRSLVVDSVGLRNRGEINLFGKLDSFVAANFPRMRYFTNEGSFTAPNVIWLGADRGTPYDLIRNSGLIRSDSQNIKANLFENSGRIYALNGPVVIQASSAAKLDDGTITASSSFSLTADELKARNSKLSATGFTLNVNRVADGGSNVWQTLDGFELSRKPEGDLFGFQISSLPPVFAQSRHAWSAEDRGNTVAGFTNNAVIGRLYLVPTNFSSFLFEGVGRNQALYVDYLSITNVATNDLANVIQVAPDFALYFADSNIPVELLTGLPGGRIHWCRNFVGPYSSIAMVDANGRTNYYNRALRYSNTIDSDGDGLVNNRDSTPFAGVQIRDIDVLLTPKPSALITWMAATQTLYTVQYATNLTYPSWLFLTNATLNAPSNSLLTVQDLLPKNPNQRYYRVVYQP